MGQNSRQRRAAKQRQQHREHHLRTGGVNLAAALAIEQEALASATEALARTVQALTYGIPAAGFVERFRRHAERHQQIAVDARFEVAVAQAIAGGWTPLDLYEVVRRKTSSRALAHLLDAVAVATSAHPSARVDRVWREQLEQLPARPWPAQTPSPALRWARAAALDWPTAVGHLLDVLAVVDALPRVETVLPAPGAALDRPASTDGVDARALRRVRGLLAKAESTDHVAEAEALTAKAQELMTRYSIERAVAEAHSPRPSAPGCRRVWLDAPYANAKSLLVTEVARANNCRAVHASAWGFVTIIGHTADLDLTELLSTSLLLQATRAVAATGPTVALSGTSRTRSFRQSFLTAYAVRVGERLRESVHVTESAADSERGGALVPVLAARRAAVDESVRVLFPNLRSSRISSSNGAGWGAGRAAADLARFDVHSAIRAG